MSSRTRRAAAGWTLALLAPATAVLLLAVTHGLDVQPVDLPDPGPITRWGAPVARTIRDLSAALTIGLLALAVLILPGEPGTKPGSLSSLQRTALRFGTAAAATWSLAGAAVLVLTYAEISGTAPTFSSWPVQVQFFAAHFDLGRALSISLLLSIAAALTAVAATRLASAMWALVLAAGSLLPLALTGHAAGAADHARAVDAQVAHLLGVSVWLGALAGLVLVRRQIGAALPTVVDRYSRLAGWCFALVAVSGTVSAAIRLDSWSDLYSAYGALLSIKVFVLCALGVAGWIHRRRLIPTLAAGRSGRPFLRLAVAELALMALAMGTAVALSRTVAPTSSTPRPLTTAESLLGYAMPPPLSPTTLLTQWRVDTLWLPVALLAVGWYIYAIMRLRRRGDAWPIGRAIAWLLGWILIVLATSASPGVYGSVLFSMHMVQHMTIAMAAPVLLVLGAPVTLALRTLPHRTDGSRGPREWLLAFTRSRTLHWLAHPLVAAPLFIGSLVTFYYSPLFETALRTHTGHVLMTAHFILVGYLFASVIVGIDPGPTRPVYPLRLILLMATFAFHALFAVTLMGSTQILGQTWFASLGRDWGNTLAREQYLGGAIGWALGDYPVVILICAMTWAWIKSDEREARRYDRRADRDGEATLAAYNKHLQRLAETPSASEGPSRSSS